MFPTHEEIRKNYISNFKEFPIIIKRVEVLSTQNQIVFMACCVERMLLNYYLVEGLPGWGCKAILEDAMSQIWKLATNERLDSTYIYELKESVIECASDPDEYSPPSDYYVVGFSAIDGIAYLLEAGLKQNICEIIPDIFAALLCPLEDYIEIEQATKEIDMNKKSEKEQMEIIMNHPATQLELKQQKSDLDILENYQVLTADLIDTLRINARNTGWAWARIPERH